MSDAFQGELKFLGIESSPALMRAPEGNGCAERFIRTLKKNLLWVRTFDAVEQLRQALLEFRRTYNSMRLIERHGFRTPDTIRNRGRYTRPASGGPGPCRKFGGRPRALQLGLNPTVMRGLRLSLRQSMSGRSWMASGLTFP